MTKFSCRLLFALLLFGFKYLVLIFMHFCPDPGVTGKCTKICPCKKSANRVHQTGFMMTQRLGIGHALYLKIIAIYMVGPEGILAYIIQQ